MKVNRSFVFAAVAGFLIICSPAFAHHGGGMYDRTRTVSVKGTVTVFDWANPHVMIFVDGTDGKAGTQKWSVETRGGPKVLAKAGWGKDTIKVGEEITLVGYPNKNGSPNMRLQKVRFTNGMELYPGSE
jgi:Family of unknown function (DUF6152)